MRHLFMGRVLLGLVCCTGVAGTAWAQGSTSPNEPAPASATSAPPAPAAAPAPEPGSALAALLAPPPVVEAAHATAMTDERPTRSGFVVGASLGLSLAVVGTSGPQPTLQPGIALGWKIDRAVLTVGAEFANLSTSVVTAVRSGAKSSVSSSDSAFLIVPGVQIALVRSGDGRVEMLGAARFGIGGPTNNTSTDPAVVVTPSTLTTSRTSFMYELAPGVRYWAHRHFALNLLAGFRGDYLFLSTSGTFPKDTAVTSVVSSSTAGTNGIFASIGGIGVF